MLRKAEGQGRLETAKRLRAVIGDVFRYAIATARAVNDPTFAHRAATTLPVVKHRAAITDPIQLGGLMRAIDGFHGQPSTNAALRLMPGIARPSAASMVWAADRPGHPSEAAIRRPSSVAFPVLFLFAHRNVKLTFERYVFFTTQFNEILDHG